MIGTIVLFIVSGAPGILHPQRSKQWLIRIKFFWIPSRHFCVMLSQRWSKATARPMTSGSRPLHTCFRPIPIRSMK
ncbi:hypothetical protein BCAR13_60283 [Paraburkholderia caribensis]|nr:hypothetical protein BCAR13_60283 [Paraburkholderia caribensis]